MCEPVFTDGRKPRTDLWCTETTNKRSTSRNKSYVHRRPYNKSVRTCRFHSDRKNERVYPLRSGNSYVRPFRQHTTIPTTNSPIERVKKQQPQNSIPTEWRKAHIAPIWNNYVRPFRQNQHTTIPTSKSPLNKWRNSHKQNEKVVRIVDQGGKRQLHNVILVQQHYVGDQLRTSKTKTRRYRTNRNNERRRLCEPMTDAKSLMWSPVNNTTSVRRRDGFNENMMFSYDCGSARTEKQQKQKCG